MSRTRIADVAAIPPPGGGALNVVIDGAEVGLYRVGEEIAAWRSVCPHGAAPVCRGDVSGTRVTSNVYQYEYGRDQEILQCPWHGWEFDLRNGEHIAKGSTARLRRYPISVVDGGVYDDLSRSVSTELLLLVSARVDETVDIASLELTSADQRPLPAWTPGTHLEIVLPSGRIRHYSLCGDPADRTSYRIAVLREPLGRGGSSELHEFGRPGAVLEVRAVRNRFPLRRAPRHLLIAGGIGITTLLPMATALNRRRKPFDLVYSGRDASSMAFADVVTAMPEARIIESSRTGRVDLRAILASAPDGTAVYCCGPAGMIAELRQIVADDQHRLPLSVEAFTGGVPDEVETPTMPDAAFDVELAGVRTTIRVGADQSILRALERVIAVPSSCETGWCGTCETPVLAGEPDHRDRVLSEAERAVGDRMMVCVSRSRSERLVLDL